MTVYLVLRDEHNNLVRVPSHTDVSVHYGLYEPPRYTGMLLQCEGIVNVPANGSAEEHINLHGSAWLQTSWEHEAEQAREYEELRRSTRG